MKKMVLTLCGVLFSFAMYAQNETVNGELTVNGKTTISTNSDAIISLLNTDNSWQYIQFLQSGTRKAYVGLDASNNFVLAKENGGNFYFTGGNLGLGVYNPTVKLDVDGSIKATGTFTAGYGHFKDASDAPLRIESTDAYSGIRFKDPFNSGYLWYNGQNETFAIGGNGSNVNGKKLHVAGGTSIGVAYEGSPIPGNGLAVQGNVGIGTITADGVLHLKGDSTADDVLLKMELDGNRNWQFQQNGTGAGTGLKLKSTANKAFTLTSSDFFLFDPADESYGLRFVPGNATNKGGKILAGSTFDHSLELTNTGSGGYNLFVDGNVGIGTNTPDEKMVVQVTDARRYVKFKAPNGEERVQFYVGGTGNPAQLSMFAANGTSRNVQIATAGTSYFKGGDLGIGTSNPTNRLHVVDDRTGYAPVVVENSNPAGLGLLVKAGDGSTYVADFRKADNTNLVRIDGSGNVGIGTTTPDAKLAVNGTIHTKEVKVDLTGWPDYVFAKEYDLLSVEEVADFIKKNGHLPKMPSAAAVEKDGVLLGDMNKKLLEKIEELTLYTIEQEKKIKALEQQNKRIEQLEAQMKKLLSGKE